MDRRGFIGTLIGGIAGVAAQRIWPFRVYSFPQEIRIVSREDMAAIIAELETAKREFADIFVQNYVSRPEIAAVVGEFLSIANKQLNTIRGYQWIAEDSSRL